MVRYISTTWPECEELEHLTFDVASQDDNVFKPKTKLNKHPHNFPCEEAKNEKNKKSLLPF